MKVATMLHTQTQKASRPTHTTDSADRRRCIRDLNDAFRKQPFCGANQFLVTMGVVGLSDADRRAVIEQMISFHDFTEANDPHGEHDFGAFMHKGQKLFWKIDYYSANKKFRSPDPSDASLTCRVLTLMLASEF